MIKSVKVGNQDYKQVLAIVGIIIFTAVMIIPFIMVGQLGVHSDWSFHSARVQQIYLNLKRGQFLTYIGTDTFSKVGNANFLFYPVVFLYPWAFLKFIFTPITAYLIYVWLLFIATGLTAFFCMQSFSRGKTLQSFYFSIIYLIATYHLYLTLTNYVLGEAIAYTFIPIVLLGMYKLLYKGEWVTLAIGMTLMAYSHYVSLFISVEVCLLICICYLIQNNNIKLSQLFSLLKSIVLFMLLSFWQFVPLITDYVGKGLASPKPGFWLMQNLGDFIAFAFSNSATNGGGIGLVLIVTALLGWKFIDKNSKYMWAYLLGILLLLMITTVFPWQYFSTTPLAIIQFPYRYTSWAVAFLSIALSKGLFNIKFQDIKGYRVSMVLIVVFMLLYAGSVYSDYARNIQKDGSVPILFSKRKGEYRTLRDSRDTPIIINNRNYDYQFSYGALYGETDYMPTAAFNNSNSIFNHASYINGKKVKIKQESLPNKIVYTGNFKKNDIVNLPSLAYTNTVVKADNKIVPHQTSKRGTVEIKLLQHTRSIMVTYVPTKILMVGWTVSLITWFILIGVYFKEK